MTHPDPRLVAEFHDKGFIVVPGAVPADEAHAMRPLLQQCIDDDIRTWSGKPGYIDRWMVHNLMVRGEPFLRLLENAVMHAYLSATFSDTCIIYAYTSSSMPPRGSNYSARIHNDSP